MLTLQDCLSEDPLVAQISSCRILVAARHLPAADAVDQSLVERLLSRDEQQRWEKLATQAAKADFLSARAGLRELISDMTQANAAALQFAYSPRGKPELSTAAGAAPLQFNLSHTDGLAVYGFSAEGAVGIDVEKLRTDLPVATVAAAALNETEAAQLAALPPAQRRLGLANLWTAKEALIKVNARGLEDIVDIFAICGLSGAASAEILSGRPYLVRWDHGWLRNLRFGAQYSAAIAVDTSAAKLRLRLI